MCKTAMLIFKDTLLCPKCDSLQLWDLAQINNFIKDPKAWDAFKRGKNENFR